MQPGTKKLIASLLIIILVSTSCSSYKIVQRPYNKQINVRAGDQVKIVTAEGEQHEITVAAITDEAISGASSSYAFSDLSYIERKEFSLLKTGGLGIGIFILASFLAFAIFAANLEPHDHPQNQ